MRLLATALSCSLSLSACDSRTPAVITTPDIPRETHSQVHAAAQLTQRYADSEMQPWHLLARAGGNGCDVLIVETQLPIDALTVEAMHYGRAAYDFLPGGINRFRRQYGFRGVAYIDGSGYVWEFGRVNAEDRVPCR